VKSAFVILKYLVTLLFMKIVPIAFPLEGLFPQSSVNSVSCGTFDLRAVRGGRIKIRNLASSILAVSLGVNGTLSVLSTLREVKSVIRLTNSGNVN
jgi:hypothetical protein